MGQNIVMGGIITLKCKDLRIISLEIKYAKDFFNVSASLRHSVQYRTQNWTIPFSTDLCIPY